MNTPALTLRFLLARWLPLLALALSGAAAWAQEDPPGRVATVSHLEGSVAFAPAGETEWTDALINRPITRGDRLWTDPGGRAEVHLGSAALHMGSETFLEVIALDDDVLQLSLNEGTLNVRVRQLDGGENFEITTPQLAFRATQPGDYRIDADVASGTTRVTVRSGIAVVHGAGGGALQLQAGQRMAFAGRDLAAAAWHIAGDDGLDAWAAARNHLEDRSIAARYVPRDVVGYQQLDEHGVWALDATYGPVWYPRAVAADWAPYRYGRWDWIAPWGWTWIDDAPWGFAPFHYGRWAQIGARWCWVPGQLGPRPVYAPALVAFVGGGSWNLTMGSGPGIAWFPLAPGEYWRPAYRTSAVYVRNVNRHVFGHRSAGDYFHQRRPDAITAVRVEDFNRGRPVHQHWNRGSRIDLSRAPVQVQPVLPEPRRWGGASRDERRVQPRMQPPAPGVIGRPQTRRDDHEQQQREHAARQQQAQHEHTLRQQQAARERFTRQQERQQERQQMRGRPQPQPSLPQTDAPAAVHVPPTAARDDGRERAQDRGWRGQQRREERAVQREGEGGRGRRDHRIN